MLEKKVKYPERGSVRLFSICGVEFNIHGFMVFWI